MHVLTRDHAVLRGTHALIHEWNGHPAFDPQSQRITMHLGRYSFHTK